MKTNKERILDSLLEGPKTTRELLIELEYENKQYSFIDRDLKKLKALGFIKGEKTKLDTPGNDPTLWSILPSFKNFREMLETYPSLLPKMQKSDLVYESVFSVMMTRTYSISYGDDGAREYKESQERSLSEEDEKELKEKMKLSPEFFRSFLLSSTENWDRLKKLAELFELKEGNWSESLKRFDKHWPGTVRYGLDKAFEACVSIDILKGQANEEEIELLIEKEKKKI